MSSLTSEGNDLPTTTDDAWLRRGRRKSGAGRLRRIPTMVREGGLDLRNTWQVVAGAILLPLGIAVILLGWSGAAHGRVEQQQIPYLISGGLLGLASVVIGGFFFWAHWLYRIYDQADLHHEESMRQQAELIRALLQLRGDASAPTAAAAAAAAATAAAGATATAFVATRSGTSVHRPDCTLVANRAGQLRAVTAAEAARLKPCRVCDPLGTA
ncbi:MAG TPA: hypothetical protein VG650_00785 [Mycobacteriales bacterium]|nr:hypothetical protein [Mycobacteriales bacterium]